MKAYLLKFLKFWWPQIAVGSFGAWTALSIVTFAFFGFGLWPWTSLDGSDGQDAVRGFFLIVLTVASSVSCGVWTHAKLEDGRRDRVLNNSSWR